ncbi:UDP-4-keto-6-deoxy-glucose-3,5-epimerase/ UDP-4-keto-rhamnose-4-keto-reductase [Aspergillus steynii IBT 23096]|uniref:UDP-4-keto-6-deoxy-glucose-3,5-epimerase/ UDP-4-keto-rhamnose-4-keto-reductase n=1 Tax=Aspergillus steynii IBT 23096 TaxID=1392250 RepID=A0A2I2GKT6_9EURO|nr:UDP-4-keto-6-deoxy-glucose-3,5-epimerase/ UDP-4-keto-rhamnose-4-keto-reductase [Aspergillus steynii IBT 23096]PLB53459.1 UDP-4-keto-6-deoxy-glucose-3,5-epimerase/ UDP-4-keto-rhamnose-4-keto-reductase [Aspergillus steynii IBT 23096]
MVSVTASPPVFLMFGNGWIANQLKDVLVSQGKTIIMSQARTESREQVLSELIKHKPSRVINCAGTRGTPNVDWCEEHKVETVRSNILGTLNVVDVCHGFGIHVTQIGSACIYTLSEEEIDNHPPFKETDEPFFQGSWYARSRLLSELSIRHYPNLLLLRIRLPIAADMHRNNHLSRLLGFEKIVDRTGSGTVLPDLLPGAVILSENAETGIYNFVTPGEISNVELMELAKKYIRPNLAWKTFGLDDMLAILKAPRANCIMDATKLQNKLREYGFEVKERREALEGVFQTLAQKGL